MTRKKKPVPVDKFIRDIQQVIYDTFHDYLLWFVIQTSAESYWPYFEMRCLLISATIALAQCPRKLTWSSRVVF